MAKRSDVSWMNVLQHVGQVIAAFVALIYAAQRLRRDFHAPSGPASVEPD